MVDGAHLVAFAYLTANLLAPSTSKVPSAEPSGVETETARDTMDWAAGIAQVAQGSIARTTRESEEVTMLND